MKDKTKRISILRLTTQLLFFALIFYVSIVAVWKGLLLLLIFGATLFFGRVFCGWMCPLGLYMDIITLIRRALKIRHWQLPDSINRFLHKSRYTVAAVILLLAVPSFILGTSSLVDSANFITLRQPFTPYAFFLEPLQPIVLPWKPPFGALFTLDSVYLTFPYVGEILLYLQSSGIALALSYLFVIAVLAASFKVRRFWCRFCPTGISIAAANRFKLLGWMPFLRLSKDREKCTKCGICKRVCPLQVTEVYDRGGGKIDTSMCTLCLRCLEMCPQEECLSLKLGSKTVFRSRNWLEEPAAISLY
ncbi:MAG: 4Fe-4S binding protein [Candidatus Bathyarchaeia archaeon]